jgi:iron-sulfur cluster repair protein YtfE (RIC family)
MTSTTSPSASPRRGGEPEVDLVFYRLLHRAMLADVAALADVTDRAACADPVLTAARAKALAGYVDRLCGELAAVHRGEDAILWPLVAAAAGAAVDLGDLADDHHAMDPLLVRARTFSSALTRDPQDLPMANRLAGTVTDLLDLLTEHVADAERCLFPAIARYVSVADFAAARSQLRRDLGPAQLLWLLPWLAHHATGDELHRALAGAGPAPKVLLTLGGPAFRRSRAAALGA